MTFHSSKPPRLDNVTAYQAWAVLHYNNLFRVIEEITDSRNGNIICDRAHLGETVYGPMFRKTSPDFVWDLESRFYWVRDAILITLVDTPENISARDDGNGLEENTEQLLKTRNGFIDAFNRSCIKKKKLIDLSTGLTIEQVQAEAFDFLEGVKWTT